MTYLVVNVLVALVAITSMEGMREIVEAVTTEDLLGMACVCAISAFHVARVLIRLAPYPVTDPGASADVVAVAAFGLVLAGLTLLTGNASGMTLFNAVVLGFMGRNAWMAAVGARASA